MSEKGSVTESPPRALGRKATWLICLLTLLVAAGITSVIFSTEPVAQRETATRESPMLVNVVKVRSGTFRPTIINTGTVTPAREIQLSPQVSGLVMDVHPEFVPGGLIEQGEILATIEPEDYRNVLQQKESEWMQAKTDLELEMGRQEIARQDFQRFGDTISQDDLSLVLREPQLAAAKIRMEAAQAAVQQAKLNLERTTIECPFDAQILSRSANLGSQVSSSVPLAHIVGVDTYWVIATVPLSNIPYLQFPGEEGGEGAPVELRNVSAWPQGLTRTGRLFKQLGSLNETTRLARLVIEVDDPLARTSNNKGLPPLVIDEFLEVRIQGKPIENVVRLKWDYLRSNDTVWVMDEDSKLRIRPLEIVFKDARYAYIREGVEDGDRVVTTHLSTVTDGADLRVEERNPEGGMKTSEKQGVND